MAEDSWRRLLVDLVAVTAGVVSLLLSFPDLSALLGLLSLDHSPRYALAALVGVGI